MAAAPLVPRCGASAAAQARAAAAYAAAAESERAREHGIKSFHPIIY